MTNYQPPQGDDPAAATSAGSDPLDVLNARAQAAAARRDASVTELRRVMDDQEVLAEFGIDLSRLEG